MNGRYLQPFAGARWAISRRVAGRTLYLVQNSSMDCEEYIETILRTLHVPATDKNIDLYFPVRGKQGRCPTLDLLELFSTIDRIVEEQKPAVSV